MIILREYLIQVVSIEIKKLDKVTYLIIFGTLEFFALHFKITYKKLG